MNQYSETIGSFIRTGDYPLEANYIFPNEESLKEFYADSINATTLHSGLLRIVEKDADGNQAIFWVIKVKEATEDSPAEYEFNKLISGKDISNIYNQLANGVSGVSLSTSPGNMLINKDGVFYSLETTFENGVLSIIVNGETVQSHNIGLSAVLNSGKYDSETESIILNFNTVNGSEEQSIPVAELIEEWIVANTSTVTLSKERNINGKDVLTANVNISSQSGNALTQSSDGLLVSLDDYAKKSELPEEYDDSDVKNRISKLESIDHSQYLTEHQSLDDYYNKSEVDTKIAEVVAGGEIDLSSYETIESASEKYQPKEDGKGLSSNDYTTIEKNKLSGIEEGAEVNVQSDWNETDTESASYIKNKPDSLLSNGGNSDTVNGHTVLSDVPSDAVFTDTTYSVATTEEDGLMSSVDKKNFDNIPNIISSAPTITTDYKPEGIQIQYEIPYVTTTDGVWNSNKYWDYADVNAATTTTAGVMSAVDKTNLDKLPDILSESLTLNTLYDKDHVSIEYYIPEVSVNSNTGIIERVNIGDIVNINSATTSTAGLMSSTDKTNFDKIPDFLNESLELNITYQPNTVRIEYYITDMVQVESTGLWEKYGVWEFSEMNAATSTTAGIMSASDKAKLDNLRQIQVVTQAEYDALEEKDPDTVYYIKG